MAFLGVLSKIGQGIARNNQLDKLIKLHTEIDSSSILDHYKSEQRFIYANEIIDVYYSNDPKNFEHKNECLENLYREFNKMIESNEGLENPATKAQMYALALAIKELSFGLESDKERIDQSLMENKAEFEKIKKYSDDRITEILNEFEYINNKRLSEFKNKFNEFENTNNKELNELKNKFNEFENTNNKRLNELKNEFFEYKIESNSKFDIYNMEIKNSINTIHIKIEEKNIFLKDLIEKMIKKVIIILGVSFFILLTLILIV